MYGRNQAYRILLMTALICAFLVFTASIRSCDEEDISQRPEDEAIDDDDELPCAVAVDTPIFRNVTVAEADSLIKANNGVRCFAVLDVRTQTEFEQGRIPSAIKYDFNSGEFQTILDMLDKHTAYLVYCRSGNRSAKAAELMRDRGFSAVYNMLGGFNDWKAANLPEEK
jgi:rhodanese-related sulfurtransferase